MARRKETKTKPPLPPIERGHTISIQAEWEDTSRNGIVARIQDNEITLINDEVVYTDEIVGVGEKLSEENLFTIEQDLWLSQLPQEFRGFVSYYAYEHGHSAGYSEVMIYVRDLVQELKKPIKDYTDRITRGI